MDRWKVIHIPSSSEMLLYSFSCTSEKGGGVAIKAREILLLKNSIDREFHFSFKGPSLIGSQIDGPWHRAWPEK